VINFNSLWGGNIHQATRLAEGGWLEQSPCFQNKNQNIFFQRNNLLVF
jgi:hypothetical protein